MDDAVFEDYSTQRVYIAPNGEASAAGSETESSSDGDDTAPPRSRAGVDNASAVIVISDSDDDEPVVETGPKPAGTSTIAAAAPSGGSVFALMMASSAKLTGTPQASGRHASRKSGHPGPPRGATPVRHRGPCPFYKRIPGTSFVVDCFEWAVPGCRHFFLSHFHSDHYAGLDRSFDGGTVVCSEATAALIVRELRVPPSRVRAVPLYRPSLIEGVRVTLLDANHCPGAAMLLFEVPTAEGGLRRHLHVGDFRWTPRMAAFPALVERPAPPGDSPLASLPKRIDTLFLDTTFCHPAYDFPPQAAVRESPQAGRA